MKLKAILASIFIYLLFFLYALVRHSALLEAGLEHIYVYIANKALAISGLTYLATAFLLRYFLKNDPQTAAKYFGNTSFYALLVHGLMSFRMLSPEYFQNLYAGSEMNIYGELTWIFGVIALSILTIYFMAKQGSGKFKIPSSVKYVLLFIVFLHVTSHGIKDWFSPAVWNRMPPISLLSAIIAIVASILLILKKKGNRNHA